MRKEIMLDAGHSPVESVSIIFDSDGWFYDDPIWGPVFNVVGTNDTIRNPRVSWLIRESSEDLKNLTIIQLSLAWGKTTKAKQY